MYSKAVGTIKKYNMLQRGDKIVAGLSGGADSCALIHLLAGLRDELGIEVTAVHINHGIRGAEADGDEDFAREFCQKLGVAFIAYHCDVPAEARKRGLGEEETGRLIRYEKFRETAERVGANKIAVAHNLNDRAETFLMNLCRGSGMKGLSGIPAVSGDIIRPLIECSRESIEMYCAENSIDFRTDSTNLKNDYTRNKIRNILIPWLRENINPSADMNISAASELLREEEGFLEGMANEVLEKAVIERKTDFTALDCETLLSEDPVIIRRVLRAALRKMRPDLKDLAKVHIESAENILSGKTGRKISLPDGITVSKSYGRLEISRGRAEKANFCYEIKIGEKYFIKEIGKFIFLSLKPEKISGKYVNICTKKLDYDKIKGKITLRTRQAGDHISIRDGRKKLKDFFIDEKIPADKRDAFPLLACGNSVIVAGDRLGQEYYIGAATKNILYIYIWEATENG